MRDRLDEFDGADDDEDVDVVLVTFTDDAEIVSYRSRHDLPFPILLDPDLALYRAYGFGRASARRVWSFGTLRQYASILRRDGLGALERPTEDTRQLGGDVVVAPDGTLAWGFWSEGPDDRPSVDELLAAVRSASR